MQADKLRELLAKATPGPWAISTKAQWESGIDFFAGPNGSFCFPLDLDQEDVDLIAAMHEALPELLAIAEASEGLRADAMRWQFVRPRLWLSDAQAMIDEYPSGCTFADGVEQDAADVDAAIDAALSGAVTQGEG